MHIFMHIYIYISGHSRQEVQTSSAILLDAYLIKGEVTATDDPCPDWLEAVARDFRCREMGSGGDCK